MSKLLIAILAAAVCGCVERRNGPDLFEPGEVYDTCFVPQGHGSDYATGISSKGEMVSTFVDVTIPARYAIVFKCQHGKFVIDGERGSLLYRKLSRGDHVQIQYCEVFEISDGQTNKVDLHFIDANVVPETVERGGAR